MTTPTSPQPERDLAEGHHQDAQEQLQEADALPMYDAKESHHLAWAQVHLLRAIYRELRHGHDQQARPAAAGQGGGVWVMLLEGGDNVRYVRGDQILEVRRVGPPAASPAGGKPGPWEDPNWFLVEATISDPKAPDSVLWRLPDHAAAAAAARTLLQLLASGRAGVVQLSDDNRVELVPFDEWAGRP